MKLLKRELFLCVAVTAFVFLCALAFGSPFLGDAPNSNTVLAQTQSQSTQAISAVFKGTVLRNGEQFVLREGSGQIFRLDDPQHAQAFENQTVRVTGKLDAGAKTIHVERIGPDRS